MNVNIPPPPAPPPSVCHNENQRNNIFWWRNAMNVNIPPSVCHNEDQRNNIFWWRNIQGTFTSPAYVYQRERLKVPPCSGEPQASPLKPYNYSSAASFSFNSLATRRMSAAKPQSATMRWTSAPGLAWKMRHDGHDVLLCSAVGLTPVSSNKIMQPLECHAYEGKLETTNLSLNVLISKSKQYQCCTELPPNFAQRTIQNHSGALSHSQHLKLQSLSCLSMSISSHDQLNRTSNRLTTKRKRKAHAKTSLTADCFTSYWRVAISNLFSDLISGLLSSVSIAAHHVDPTTSTHQVFAHLRCKVSSKGCQGQGSAWKTIVLSWRLQQ